MIQADRTFYTTDVVERMQMRGIVLPRKIGDESRLPLPAQFMSESGRLVSAGRSGLRYRLISNWAINNNNSPIPIWSDGSDGDSVNPDQPYTAVTNEGGIPLSSTYVDTAVSQSCVGCHNAHPNSPKKDFKPRDVMGGILLTIPLGQ